MSPQLLPGTVKAYIHWAGCGGALYRTTLRVQWDSFVIKGRPEEEVRERCDSVECEGKGGNEEEREAHRSLGLAELDPVLHPPPPPPAGESAHVKHLQAVGPRPECFAACSPGAHRTRGNAGVENVLLMSEVRGSSRLVGGACAHAGLHPCLNKLTSHFLRSSARCT